MSKPATFARIRDLKRKHQLAFAAALLERMLPNYALFSELDSEQEYDFKILRNALDLLWQQTYDKSFKVDIDLLIEKIELQIPEQIESDSIGLYAAIDAGMALVATLELLQLPQDLGDKEATYPALISQGTIERLLITSGEVEHSKEAQQHPHMQWEIETQNELLDLLEQHKKVDKALCKELVALALQEGITNLAIEINESPAE